MFPFIVPESLKEKITPDKFFCDTAKEHLCSCEGCRSRFVSIVGLIQREYPLVNTMLPDSPQEIWDKFISSIQK